MWGSKQQTTADLGLLALRATVGGLLAGHGAQKLFGAFGGYGIEGTAGWLETMGLKPGRTWAYLAGGSEFGSGVLTLLGLLNPLGPIGVFGPMIMAWNKAHAGKPIWVTSGGAELPLTNMAAATALALAGPGRYSLDEALDIEVPMPIVLLAIAGVIGGVVIGTIASAKPSEEQASEAGGELQAEGEGGEHGTATELGA